MYRAQAAEIDAHILLHAKSKIRLNGTIVISISACILSVFDILSIAGNEYWVSLIFLGATETRNTMADIKRAHPQHDHDHGTSQYDDYIYETKCIVCLLVIVLFDE